MIRFSTHTASLPTIVEACLEAITAGGIVCVPTDTVYGLVCEPDIDAAVMRLFELKKRPTDKPFALFTPSWQHLLNNTIIPNPTAEKLALYFWPGPLTLVVETTAERLFTKDFTVGVRCPQGEVIQALLERKHGLLVNTSLNLSGAPPHWSLESAEELLQGVDVVVDAGELPQRSPSTVVDCVQSPPRILRAGDVTEAEIRRVVLD